jgi:TonB family protein
VFDRGDRDIVAPVEIARPMPVWTPDDSVPRGLYQGVLEVVIGATGRVASATVRRSVHPSYDVAVVAATESWHFEPATQAGVPVAYRRLFELIVHTRRSGGGGAR